MNAPGLMDETKRMDVPQNAHVRSMWRNKRLFVMIFLFTASLINYADRINMSIAAPSVAKEFGWDAGIMGLVLSSYLWSYTAFLIPAGWLTDKLGPRKLNSLGISFWSLATMVTAGVSGFGTMMAARLALGVGEATTWPSSGKIIRNWFPSQERGLATTMFRAGGDLGATIAMPVVAWLVVKSGWRMSFVILGAVGFVWLIFWVKYYRSPEQCTWLPAAERDYILANNGSGPAVTAAATDKPKVKGVVLRLLGQQSMWGLGLSQGCIVYTQYLILTWLPSYLVQVRHMQLVKASVFSSAAFLIAMFIGIGAGKLSDMLLTPEKVLRGHRRTLIVVCMLISCSISFVGVFKDPIMVFAMVTLAKAFVSASMGLNLSLTNDLVTNPAVAGTAFGIQLLCANVIALMAPIVTGFIVKTTGSFDSGFYLAGAILIIGILISLTCTRKPITIS